MLKKLLTVVTLLFTLAFVFTGCSKTTPTMTTPSKITVITTLFPQYDFVKQIAREKVDVTLLLPPGTESHTYDPTPKDVLQINSADLFLYTGKYMEPWAEKIIAGVNSQKVLVKDLSEGINLLQSHNETSHHSHDHNHVHEHHQHEYDPHFWLDPTLAAEMVDNIAEALCSKDSLNKDFYLKNAEEYKAKLCSLDSEIKDVVEKANRKDIVFAGRFAHLYFIKRYGLKYMAAFDTCSSEAEPSVKKVTEIIDFIKKNEIPVVYYEELSEPKIANSICEATGAKSLKFGTLHNVSKEQLEQGVTYLELMNENLQNLKQGLN